MSLYVLFESYTRKNTFIEFCLVHSQFVSMIHFSDALMALKDPRFRSERESAP